jgi:glucose-1-phosphate cytidylyltransferase
MRNNDMEVHQENAEPWNVTLVDTGLETMTGGRIKRIKDFVKDETEFCLTYGDGLSDIDINKLIEFHKSQNTLATVSGVYPPGRFGSLELDGNKVKSFKEKPKGDGSRVNGGFFILSPEVIDYIEGDQTVWEQEPMEQLAQSNQMAVFFHDGFWQPMDTLRDKINLETLWSNGAPWKIW